MDNIKSMIRKDVRKELTERVAQERGLSNREAKRVVRQSSGMLKIENDTEEFYEEFLQWLYSKWRAQRS
jgi:hypothetical protein